MMKRLNILLLAAVAASTVQAQELHETLRVEGEYIPEVIRQDKIYTFPGLLPTENESSRLPFSPEGVVSAYSPEILPMTPLGWETRRKVMPRKGYFTLGAGSYLDVTGNAGYRFVDTENTSAGVFLKHNSTSLFRAHPEGMLSDRYRYRYDELLGVHASHSFEHTGTLSGELWYHFGYFNYYGLSLPETYIPAARRFPTQTLNDAGISLKWVSDLSSPLSYNVKAAYRYFGYRDCPLPFYSPLKGDRESVFRLDGGIAYGFTESSSVGLDLGLHVAGYADTDESSRLDSYGILSLTPAYSLSKGNLKLKAGIRADIAFNAGPKDDRYSTFHIAPDVRVDWRKGVAGIYLHAGGGSTPFTLASGYELDYYQSPLLNSTLPIYSPLDLKAGFVAGPVKGFTAEISLAYRISKNNRTGGWFMAAISPGFVWNNLPDGYTFSPMTSADYKINGLSVGADFRVEAGKYLEFHAAGTYQPQNGTKGYFNGYDRPRWTADLSVTGHPIENLDITLGYEYRGVRKIYTSLMPPAADGFHTPEPLLVGMHLPDITNLSLGASWRVTDSFSLWVKARNLLCRKVQILPLQKEEGLGIMAGFGIVF